jgi:hypothetical protein
VRRNDTNAASTSAERDRGRYRTSRSAPYTLRHHRHQRGDGGAGNWPAYIVGEFGLEVQSMAYQLEDL